MLEQILKRLDKRPKMSEKASDFEQYGAAVLVPLVNHRREPSVVLTKRAEHLSSHSGQVAFPGGKLDDCDAHLLETALRESEEEIALNPKHVDIIAELPPMNTILDMRVLPYLGLVAPGLSYVANKQELDAIFEVPLSFLMEQNNLTSFNFETLWGDLQMPCYRYEGYLIWGFTLNILVGLLNYTLDAGLTLEYPPETLSRREDDPICYEESFQ